MAGMLQCSLRTGSDRTGSLRAACRWLVTTGVLVLVGLASGDAEAQDRTQDSTVERERISVDAAATGNVYFDDFDRNDLGDKYSIVDPDPNQITLSKGKLVILGTNPRKNVVLLDERFSGDFVATVMVSMEVAKNNFVGNCSGPWDERWVAAA